MTQSPPRQAVRLGDIEFDEERWRKLVELARADRRDVRAYLTIVAEAHIDRRWPQLIRKRAAHLA